MSVPLGSRDESFLQEQAALDRMSKFMGIRDEGWRDVGPRPKGQGGRFTSSHHRREIKGQMYRICLGPGHDVPTWLPETEKYFHQNKSGEREGQFSARCRICQNWPKLKNPGLSGYVPATEVKVWFEEGIRRVGVMEFSRRAGLSPTTVKNVLSGKYKRVQKKTVKRVMMAVISMRRKNEVYHKDSIRHGASARGRKVKRPTERTHFYKPGGDDDNEYRRRRRREAA